MKIDEALAKLKKKKKGKKTISSEKARMCEQSEDNLLFWLLLSDMSLGHKVENLIDILQADDWTLD